MALDVEGALDRGVNGQEALGGSERFEPLHLPFPPSCRLMRIVSPIVFCAGSARDKRIIDFGLCRAVRAQLVRHQHVRREALFLASPTGHFRAVQKLSAKMLRFPPKAVLAAHAV
jgi:hypothetical protein